MTDKPKNLTNKQRKAVQQKAFEFLRDLDKETDELAEDGSLWACTTSAEMAVSRLYIALMAEYRVDGEGADRLFGRFMEDVVLAHLQQSPGYLLLNAIGKKTPVRKPVVAADPEEAFEAELSALLEKYGMEQVTRIEGSSPQEVIDKLTGLAEAAEATKQ
jgi:hypothetical protein